MDMIILPSFFFIIVKLIRNGNVYYSSIIEIDQYGILGSFYQLWY
jgi:hypothetical protein